MSKGNGFISRILCKHKRIKVEKVKSMFKNTYMEHYVCEKCGKHIKTVYKDKKKETD